MKRTILGLLFLSALVNAHAQGCSDAGFCSLGALKEVNINTEGKQRIDIGSSIGIGEVKTVTLNPYVQYGRQLNRHLSILGKVTATYASGFLGKSFGMGDVYGVATYAIEASKFGSIHILAGVKAPLTNSNVRSNTGGVLPLDYQSSLGTYDIILGVNYIFKKNLEFDAGMQSPVIQDNSNAFFPDEYTDTRARNFAPTNGFRRKPDVLFRAGYYLRLNAYAITIKPSILAIYHLGEDSYENHFAERTAIGGTQGLTLNGAIAATKQFKNNTSLELIAAAPFVVRKVRADGLTRSAAFNIQYSILIK